MKNVAMLYWVGTSVVLAPAAMQASAAPHLPIILATFPNVTVF